MPLFILLMVNAGLFANTVYKIWQTRRQGLWYIRDKRRDEVTQTSFLHSTDSKATGNSRKKDSSVTNP
jgi:nitric oxide reductase large subunit